MSRVRVRATVTSRPLGKQSYCLTKKNPCELLLPAAPPHAVVDGIVVDVAESPPFNRASSASNAAFLDFNDSFSFFNAVFSLRTSKIIFLDSCNFSIEILMLLYKAPLAFLFVAVFHTYQQFFLQDHVNCLPHNSALNN